MLQLFAHLPAEFFSFGYFIYSMSRSRVCARETLRSAPHRHHRRARWVLPYQARFKIFSCLISNSSKNQEFIQTTSQFQARSENLKNQNLNCKQDPRIRNTKSHLRARFKIDERSNFSYQGKPKKTTAKI